ncbi:MAG: hypothetical protein RJQ01_04755 [Microcella sp.]|uniref:hypothetical protein n=1 Tax=Microcella sp. TaxID=1913979 RepID=UPI0033146CE9
MTTESNDRSDQQGTSEPAPAATQPAPSTTSTGRARTVLVATAAAVGSVLVLGLTFGGGVLLGTHLPDRGPGGATIADGPLDRLQERLEERREQREERREERRDAQVDQREAPAPPQQAPADQ